MQPRQLVARQIVFGCPEIETPTPDLYGAEPIAKLWWLQLVALHFEKSTFPPRRTALRLKSKRHMIRN